MRLCVRSHFPNICESLSVRHSQGRRGECNVNLRKKQLGGSWNGSTYPLYVSHCLCQIMTFFHNTVKYIMRVCMFDAKGLAQLEGVALLE